MSPRPAEERPWSASVTTYNLGPGEEQHARRSHASSVLEANKRLVAYRQQQRHEEAVRQASDDRQNVLQEVRGRGVRQAAV